MRNDTAHFNFYFKGTLASLKGLLDYLLEEYNDIFKLGIGPNENLYVSTFRNKANSMGNTNAIKFIDDYSEMKNKLLDDPKVGLLLKPHGVRDQEIHRKQTQRRPEIFLEDSFGNKTKPEVQPKFRFFLKAWPDDDIPTLCEYVRTELYNAIRTLNDKYSAA